MAQCLIPMSDPEQIPPPWLYSYLPLVRNFQVVCSSLQHFGLPCPMQWRDICYPATQERLKTIAGEWEITTWVIFEQQKNSSARLCNFRKRRRQRPRQLWSGHAPRCVRLYSELFKQRALRARTHTHTHAYLHVQIRAHAPVDKNKDKTEANSF